MVERSEAMPIRGSPDGAHHPRPQCGRDRPEWVVAINRNGWSQTIVTAGRDHPVRAQCRRVATRYDKLASNYLAFVQLASIRLWLRAYEFTP
jgi:transposase